MNILAADPALCKTLADNADAENPRLHLGRNRQSV